MMIHAPHRNICGDKHTHKSDYVQKDLNEQIANFRESNLYRVCILYIIYKLEHL